jgi:hypothetical protein
MKYLIWVLFLVYFAIVGTFTQHTSWPEMSVYPYLLNNGFVPYNDLLVPYPPLFLWFLQLTTLIWGYGSHATFLSTFVVALITAVLIWYIAGKIWIKDRFAPIMALGYYGIWFFYFEGNGLWFEMVASPLILLAFYYCYRYFFDKAPIPNLVLGSFFLALGFLIKQSVLWSTLALIFWILLTEYKKPRELARDIRILILPSFIAICATLIIAYFSGYLISYIDWVYDFVFIKLPFNGDYQEYPSMRNMAKLAVALVVLIPFVSLLFKDFKKASFFLGFICAALMFALPRWGIFHLQPMLAIISVSAAPLWSKYLVKGNKTIRAACILIVAIWLIVTIRQDIRFWRQPPRFYEEDKYKVADIIKQKNYLDFYAFNSADQLYVLTNTVPEVKPYVQNFYSFMELPGVQEKVILSFEDKKPKYVVFSPYSGRGGIEAGDYRPEKLANYIEQHYTLKEKLDSNFWILERNEENIK